MSGRTCARAVELAGECQLRGALTEREQRYDLGHTAMKTAISVPDDVFERVEREAKRLGVSRSELFTRAVRQFLATHHDAAVTASYDRAFAEQAGDEGERFMREAGRRTLLDVEWQDE